MNLKIQQAEVNNKLQNFDAYVEKLLQDWNAPGIGVGIVVEDQLVFAQGYGYRNYQQQLPFTSKTLFSIGSNTKLFTAIAAGMLVEEGKLSAECGQRQAPPCKGGEPLTWDEPIRDAVPTIRFYNNELTVLKQKLSPNKP